MKIYFIALLVRTALCLDQVNYGAFTETASFSIANQLGFFDAAGLNVTYLQVPNSTFGYSNLLSGGYDILTGTIDNVVNFRFNSKMPLTVLGQLDAGPDLVLATSPNITSVHQLRGQPIIVDNPVSGYAYILRKVLSLYGLKLENGDYYFQTAGATPLRYQYLTTGSLPNGTAVVATILTYPFTAMSQALKTSGAQVRPNILARVSDFIEPLSSSAVTVSQSSLSNPAKRDIIRRFFAALYAANMYLATMSNKDCSTTAIAKQLNVSFPVAEAEYAAATNSISGESTAAPTQFNVSRQGLLNIIDVRGQFAGFADINDGEGFDFIDAITPGTGEMIDYSVRGEVVEAMPDSLKTFLAKGPGLCVGYRL